MNRLGFLSYRYLIMPFVAVLLPIVSPFHKKLREGFRLRRLHWEDLPPGSPSPYWIHAASGEFEYAKSVIRELKEREPHTPIVVTYFSPSFAKSVADFPGVDLALPLPLDLPGPCQSFLRRVKPKVLLIARTDLWPEMLHQCRRLKIPIVLFSYTQKPIDSSLKKKFLSWILSQVDHIFCVSQTDRENLLPLISTTEISDHKITVMGDTRYDQVLHRLEHPRALLSALHPASDVPCLVAGSTWEADEDVLIPGLQGLLKSGHLRLILVPHEPTPRHIEQLESKLKDAQITWRRFSEGKNWSDRQVLLVDQVGVLAELYLWGDFAFVGGSFRRSVHSVMEALGANAFTLVGPYHQNNREAVEFSQLKMAGFRGLTVIQGAADLNQKLSEALANPTRLREFHTLLDREFESRVGASLKLTSRLSSICEPRLNRPDDLG